MTAKEAIERPFDSPTKVSIPELPASLVQLPRLSRLLDGAALGSVTLVLAPAGWGKTLALSSWLRSCDTGPAAAWLTVERSDDGERFWPRLSDAFAVAVPDKPPSAMDHPEGLADWLRDLDGHIRLVLDDFHVVKDPNVMDGLDVLLRHGAGRLHLIISTRVDPGPPLHRWRLHGELTELRTDQLSFTLDETEQLLARHGIELPSLDVRSLHERAEGWPGGVQLAALAMKGQADTTQIVADFCGEQDIVAQYLDAEVLRSLAPEQLDLLLCASMVDRVCGDLADALTDRRDGEQQLSDLRQASAFIVALDSRPTWYRLHHLLGEVLRARVRLDPERWRRLHARAAAWHASHDLPVAALRHALAAGDQALATVLLNGHWPELALCGGHQASSDSRLGPWEGGSDSVWQALASAAERLDANDLNAADRQLSHASRRGQGEPDPPCSVELATASLRLARARLGDEPAAIVSAAEGLLDLTDSADPTDDVDADVLLAKARTIATIALGIAQLGRGDLRSACDSLAEATADGITSPQCTAVVGIGGFALVQAVCGELTNAEQSARTALALGACPGQHPYLHREPAYLALAVVHHEWNRVTDATRLLDLADQARELGGDKTFAAWGALIRGWVLLATGELDAAHGSLLAGRRLLGHMSSPHMERWYAAAEAEVRTACGDARAVPPTLLPLLDDVQLTTAPVAVALAHAYLREGNVQAAVQAIPSWADENKADPFLALRLEAGLIEAVVASHQGDAPHAAATLERVLRMAEPDGFRRVFVSGGQAVRDLLTRQLDSGTAYWSRVRDLVESPRLVPDERERCVRGPQEPLTERELTVLRYLQSVLSNEEVASKLFVSVNTVKTHVRNIYRKLDVSRRREAVRRARELHLL